MQRTLKCLLPLWLTALVAALLVAGVPPARAATATTITVDGGQSGRTFDGIGAISGGGGNSRLLRDYPAAQQSQILDYLFKPDYGANLQLLKLEIGGDANSTDGSEPSIEHTKGQINCDAGYEFWLAEQAKARNPDIKLYGLAWAAPGWIDGGFWSTDTIDYLITWLDCARQHGLTVSYLGGWNEKGPSPPTLRATTAASSRAVSPACARMSPGRARPTARRWRCGTATARPTRPGPPPRPGS